MRRIIISAALNRRESGPKLSFCLRISGTPIITGGEFRRESKKDRQQPGGHHTDIMH